MLQSLSFFFAKIIFERHSDLGPCPLLVYRSAISCLMLILILNEDLKLVLIDSITRETIYPLAIRVIAGNFSIFVNFMAVKFFKLTLIAMVINTAPLMTFLLAMIIFKESVTIA